MSFYKRNRNNDNYIERSFSDGKKTMFQVSNKSFQSANFLSSSAITVFTFILFVTETNFIISESDIQTISEVTVGLCGFALVIPLFLKDFNVSSNFWKQFYLIAITFLIAAFISVASFLLIDDSESISVILYLGFFLSIAISINVNNINIVFNKFKSKISFNPIFNLSISYLALFISLIFSKGNFLVYATALFTIYGFYLILTLMLAILVELFFADKKYEDNDTRIKKAIQRLAEKYKDKAFDDQTMLDKLKQEEFSSELEIISRTKIQELVAEMDSETADNEPKITIRDGNVIPRWKKSYDDILNENNTVFFISRFSQEKEIDKVYKSISEKMNLSVELLKENNCISKYCLVDGYIKCDELDCSLIIKDYFLIKKSDSIDLSKFNDNDIEFISRYYNTGHYINNPIEITSVKRLSNVK